MPSPVTKPGFDTCIWGHLVWQLMNVVAYISTTHPSDMIWVKLVYALLTILIPCEPCRQFYTQCWCVSCPSNTNYLDWVYDIHSVITCKVRVTKNNIKKIGECVVPGLTRAQFYRRTVVLDAGDTISSWSIVDLLFLIAMQIHNKEGEWALPHFVKSLHNILKKSYRYKNLANVLQVKGNTPVDIAYNIYTAYSKKEKTPVQSKTSMLRRLEMGRGSLCTWMEGELTT